MKDSRLEKMMKEYNNIEIPKQLRERVEASIEQAKEDNKMEEQKVIKFQFQDLVLLIFLKEQKEKVEILKLVKQLRLLLVNQ